MHAIALDAGTYFARASCAVAYTSAETVVCILWCFDIECTVDCVDWKRACIARPTYVQRLGKSGYLHRQSCNRFAKQEETYECK